MEKVIFYNIVCISSIVHYLRALNVSIINKYTYFFLFNFYYLQPPI